MIYPTFGDPEWEGLSPGAKLESLRRQGERIEHECITFKDGLRELFQELAPILHLASVVDTPAQVPPQTEPDQYAH